MIRVTIEMFPAGSEEHRYPMHVIDIWNDLEMTAENKNFGSYGYRISRKISKKVSKGESPISWHKHGRIEKFPRSAKNVVHLLKAVLDDAYGEVKKKES